MIKERQREGIAAAKAKGTRLGAPPKLQPDDINGIKRDKAAGVTVTELARLHNVTRKTIYNALAQEPSTAAS